jgi:hypothetical protein
MNPSRANVETNHPRLCNRKRAFEVFQNDRPRQRVSGKHGYKLFSHYPFTLLGFPAQKLHARDEISLQQQAYASLEGKGPDFLPVPGAVIL